MMDDKLIKQQSQHSKVYLEIVEKLKNMIREDNLLPGDKIPSERELSDRLNAGRSSVREALRSLELLGLIETRRGEGTFIRNFQEHKLVELLGAFFVLEDKTKEDLLQVKVLLEMDCLRMLTNGKQLNLEKKEALLLLIAEPFFSDDLFFNELIKLSGNRLMERIWEVVNRYCLAAGYQFPLLEREVYRQLTLLVYEAKEEWALTVYQAEIRKLS